MCFLRFLPSYWLDQSQSLSVCLAKSWALSRGKARRQMNTHTHTHSHINRHTHARRPVPRQPHRNQVIEQSLYPGIPDITERQKICMKRETPYWAPLRLCVCVCVCMRYVSVCLLQHNTVIPWMGTKSSSLSLSISLSLIPALEWVLTACQPASEHTNESITIHIYSYPQSFLECPSPGCVMNMYSPGYCFNCPAAVQIQKLFAARWTILSHISSEKLRLDNSRGPIRLWVTASRAHMAGEKLWNQRNPCEIRCLPVMFNFKTKVVVVNPLNPKQFLNIFSSSHIFTHCGIIFHCNMKSCSSMEAVKPWLEVQRTQTRLLV